MNGREGLDAAVEGFCVGLAAPLVSLVFSLLFSAMSSVNTAMQNATGTPSPFDMNLVFLLFGLVNTVVAFVSGLRSISFAGGYCCGAFLALVVYVSFISDIFPNAQAKTIQAVLLVVSGMIVNIVSIMLASRSKRDREYEWYG
jgi:hypothetical protein